MIYSEETARIMANPQNIVKHRFKPGQSGNPKGRPKGSKNWSTIIQELLADEQLADMMVPNKPSWWNDLPQKNGANAMIVALMVKALDGDVRAADVLFKAGWGNQPVLAEADEREELPVYFIDLNPKPKEAKE
jgi:hypothetical protein